MSASDDTACISRVGHIESAEATYVWEVIGGVAQGGIIVRRGCDVASTKLNSRLMRGALVQQLGVASDQRLRYVKISGEGPAHGWVSLQASGKQLLKKVDAIVTAMLRVRSLRNPASILCIGDSLTAGGYPALLQNLLTVDSGVPAVVWLAS